MTAHPDRGRVFDAALEWAGLGFRVFPLRPGAKIPATSSGVTHLQPQHLGASVAAMDDAMNGIDTPMDTRSTDRAEKTA